MIGAPEDTEDDIALAGEYALGLLDAEETATVEDRMGRDPAFRTLVIGWQERLAGMTDAIEPVAPPPAVKTKIEARLFGAPARGSRRQWWLGLAAGLAIGAVALLVVPRDLFSPAPPAVTAEIVSGDRALVIAAAYAPDDGALTLERVAGTPAPGRAQELWLIAEGAAAPISLGLLAPEGVTRVTLPDDLRAVLAGATLAVSDEPPGGSPTGAPTGDVLAAGQMPATL